MKKLLVLAKPKFVALLLASDFACTSSLRSCPSENPRTQTRNFPYTYTLPTSKNIKGANLNYNKTSYNKA
ncbi:hypothetical protein [Mariniflexile rhizosphaerae]|uniref:hypothetical protein n=1 Tax=unclassified Mariniflexile TaxID=2643887 RepID=UPI000E3C2C5B|nr:hypothetical protein [Mariniflexile sp. TRM1-10]